jgi:hypothetical protein
MEREPQRWRFRISTLMLLVVIAALATALFVEHTKRLAAERRAAGEAMRAAVRAREDQAVAEHGRAQAARVEAQLRKALEDAKAAGSRGK